MTRPKYIWPASRIDGEEMGLLVAERQRTGKPITLLIKEAIRYTYGKRRERVKGVSGENRNQ